MTEPGPGLYVVGTPIGNLADLTPRAAAVLAAATVVAAEDTRTSGKLLKIAGGVARLVSLTEHNVAQRAPGLLEAAKDGVVALVSDAGTPIIADPGARLVDAAHAAGVSIYPIPGPSAVTAAVSVSGFTGSDFHFLGFLPRSRTGRTERVQRAATTSSVLVFFESPNRLSRTLAELSEALGDPEVAVCREMTKLHEEVVRGPASALAARFAATKGECTVVVKSPERVLAADADNVTAYLGEMKRAGARRAGAAAEAARRFDISRSRAYSLWDEG